MIEGVSTLDSIQSIGGGLNKKQVGSRGFENMISEDFSQCPKSLVKKPEIFDQDQQVRGGGYEYGGTLVGGGKFAKI